MDTRTHLSAMKDFLPIKGERWLPVIGYTHLYEVSNQGRVRSPRGILRPTHRPNGGHQVGLYRIGGLKTCLVHRLVAEAFVEGAARGKDVKHKDGNRGNCCWTNLEWVSRSESMRREFKADAEWGERLARESTKLRRPIIATQGHERFEFLTISDAARWLGSLQKAGNVRFAAEAGLDWYGYRWEFAKTAEQEELI